MLVFEKSRAGRGMSMLPACDVEIKNLVRRMQDKELHLPQMSENDLSDTIQNWQRNPMESMMDSIPWILYDEVQSEN